MRVVKTTHAAGGPAWIDLDAFVGAAMLADGRLDVCFPGAKVTVAAGPEADRVAAMLDALAGTWRDRKPML